MWSYLLILVPVVAARLLGFRPLTTVLPLPWLLALSTAVVVCAAWRAMRQPVVKRQSLEVIEGVGTRVSVRPWT